MAASRSDLLVIFRQMFVRNMSASDADQAATRFVDLYFSEGVVDLSDSNISTLNMSSAGNCNAVTVNATAAVNTVDCRSTNCNATVGNITGVVATNVNATAGNVLMWVSGTKTVNATADNVTVANVSTVFVDTTPASVVIGSFANGVAGQVVQVAIVADGTNTCTLEEAEGTGAQDFSLQSGADEAKKAGGWTLVCNGTKWIATGGSTDKA